MSRIQGQWDEIEGVDEIHLTEEQRECFLRLRHLLRILGGPTSIPPGVTPEQNEHDWIKSTCETILEHQAKLIRSMHEHIEEMRETILANGQRATLSPLEQCTSCYRATYTG